MRVKGKRTRVVAQGGDGGTTDIGFACLSGMFERNDDVLYVCYDNEAYMNTGVQRSSATPGAARTSTTPAVGDEPGNPFGTGKNVPLIAMAHGIPYVATGSVADLLDLEAKTLRAMEVRGARYLHVHVPCPLGWGTASDETVRIARLAVESGLFPLFEAERSRRDTEGRRRAASTRGSAGAPSRTRRGRSSRSSRPSTPGTTRTRSAPSSRRSARSAGNTPSTKCGAG
jgi:pyruvate ferredoxin oxidoreductase beta subunit